MGEMIYFILERTVEIKSFMIGLRIYINNRVRLFTDDDGFGIDFKAALLSVQTHRPLVFLGMQRKTDIHH
ncbi:hypothetical protein D3C75_572640 [compost metagenome]